MWQKYRHNAVAETMTKLAKRPNNFVALSLVSTYLKYFKIEFWLDQTFERIWHSLEFFYWTKVGNLNAILNC